MKECRNCKIPESDAGGLMDTGLCIYCDRMRNQFAAAALTGLLSMLGGALHSGASIDMETDDEHGKVARIAFKQADACLKARRGGGE